MIFGAIVTGADVRTLPVDLRIHVAPLAWHVGDSWVPGVQPLPGAERWYSSDAGASPSPT